MTLLTSTFNLLINFNFYSVSNVMCNKYTRRAVTTSWLRKTAILCLTNYIKRRVTFYFILPTFIPLRTRNKRKPPPFIHIKMTAYLRSFSQPYTFSIPAVKTAGFRVFKRTFYPEFPQVSIVFSKRVCFHYCPVLQLLNKNIPCASQNPVNKTVSLQTARNDIKIYHTTRIFTSSDFNFCTSVKMFF